jgi:MFS transporter, DHA1 family, multidrug resistance protein
MVSTCSCTPLQRSNYEEFVFSVDKHVLIVEFQAWTARASVHYIAPTIGLGLTIGGIYLIVQSIFLYLPFTYPKYSASLFAANDLARSAMAAGAILFSRPMFLNLGLGGGVSLLGGLTIVCAFLLYLLYRYGALLRSKSRFAMKG